MNIVVKTRTGKNIRLFVEKSTRIGELKEKIEKIDRNCQATRERLFFHGSKSIMGYQEMKGPMLMMPLLKITEEKEEKEEEEETLLMVGQGEKCIQALFLNKPNSFVKFRYSSRTTRKEVDENHHEEMRRGGEIKRALEEFCSKVESKLEFNLEGKNKLSESNRFVRLYCGDQMVFSLGNEKYHHALPAHPSIQQDRCFDYFTPRNDVWSVIIEDVHPGETLEFHNVGEGDVLMLRQFRDSAEILLDQLGKYSPGGSSVDSQGLRDGINIVMKCPTLDCSNSTSPFINTFSHSAYNNQTFVLDSRLPNEFIWTAESFDIDFDDVFFSIGSFSGTGKRRKCSKCNEKYILSKKFFFKSCYWKYSAIVLDPQVDKIRYKRLESKWEEASNSWTRHFDFTELYKTYEVVVRLQIQARFYWIDPFARKLRHPDQNYCLLCRKKLRNIYGGFSTPLCEHFFHRGCVKRYYKNSSTVRCLKCNPGKLTMLWTPDLDAKEKSEYLVNQILFSSHEEESDEDQNILSGVEIIKIVIGFGGFSTFDGIPKLFLVGS